MLLFHSKASHSSCAICMKTIKTRGVIWKYIPIRFPYPTNVYFETHILNNWFKVQAVPMLKFKLFFLKGRLAFILHHIWQLHWPVLQRRVSSKAGCPSVEFGVHKHQLTQPRTWAERCYTLCPPQAPKNFRHIQNPHNTIFKHLPRSPFQSHPTRLTRAELHLLFLVQRYPGDKL